MQMGTFPCLRRCFDLLTPLHIIALLAYVVSPQVLAVGDNRYTVAAPASWVEERKLNPAPSGKSDSAVRFIDLDRQFNLTLPTPQRYQRRVMSPTTPTGVQEVSRVSWDFDPSYQNITVHHVRVIRDGAPRELAGTLQPRLIQAEPEADNYIHSGALTLHYDIPDVRVGDVLDVAATIHGSNPIFKGKHSLIVSANWSVPVDQVVIRVLASPDMQYKVANTTGEIKKRVTNGVAEYRYVAKNVAAVKDEGDYPGDYSPYGWLEFSDFASWSEVASWAESLFDQDASSELLLATHQRLKTAAQSKADYVRRAIIFVQDEIRYLGLEFGVNSHLPRAPEEVLRNRYGDCKDKALLLSVLLKMEGVESVPALVNTEMRSGIAGTLPSTAVFDHVINYIEFNGQTYWVDATRQYQGAHLEFLGKVDYGHALLLNSGELVDMHAGVVTLSEVQVREKVVIPELGTDAEYRVSTVYRGRMAEQLRYRFTNYPLGDIQQDYLDYYRNYVDDIAVKNPIATEDDRVRNEFRVNETYVLKNYGREEQGNHVFPVVITAFEGYLAKSKLKERAQPFAIGAGARVSSEFAIQFPWHVDLELEPAITRHAFKGLTYHFADTYQNNTYVHSAQLHIAEDRVQASELKSYITFREKLEEEWEFRITVPLADGRKRVDDLNAIRKRIKQLMGGRRD